MAFIGAILGGAALVGAISSHSAAKTAAKSADTANTQLDARYQQMRSDELPFITAGTGAQAKLADYLGTSGNADAENYGILTKPFSAQDYLANRDPGYQFQLQQGNQAVQNAAGAGSGAIGGAALKDLASFNQGFAKTGYQAAFDRWNTSMSNTYARLASVASLGQNAASMTGSQGVAVGQQQSANTTAAGNAAAAAKINYGNLASEAGTNYALYQAIKP
jgi:hypothetical protein